MNKQCNITVRDEVFCNITGLESADHDFLDHKFALTVEGAHFMPLVRMGRWDGKVRFFDKAGKIYHRLLPDVLSYIEHWGYDINLQDLRKPVEIIDTRIDKDWFLRKEGMKLKVELRPYQVDAVNACLDATSGFIVAATGSGKCVDGKTPINIRCGKLIGDILENMEKP